MQLVEKHIIKSNHKDFKEIDNLSFLSKNLYNAANYTVRQEFINNGNYLNYNKIDKLLNSTKQVDYYNLPCKVSQNVLSLLDKNWKSFFKANKEYKLNPEKFKGQPKLPKYKDKIKGRNIIVYNKQAISKKELKNNVLNLSKTNIKIKTNVDVDTVNQVRIVPKNGYFVVEVVYTLQEKELIENENVVAIDLGLNNLATIVNNFNSEKKIINGKPLKSMNQYYNKTKAKLQSTLKNKFTSKNLRKLTYKRDNKVNNYLHKASRHIINYLTKLNVSKLIIGYNKNWKQEINIGKRNNQNFINIPFLSFVNQLIYKGRLEGITVILNEESYTSKCSFLDNEKICKHENYVGKRIKRGLFQTKNKLLINSDVNGALNILKKVIPTFSIENYGIEAVVVQPLKINLGFI